MQLPYLANGHAGNLDVGTQFDPGNVVELGVQGVGLGPGQPGHLAKLHGQPAEGQEAHDQEHTDRYLHAGIPHVSSPPFPYSPSRPMTIRANSRMNGLVEEAIWLTSVNTSNSPLFSKIIWSARSNTCGMS